MERFPKVIPAWWCSADAVWRDTLEVEVTVEDAVVVEVEKV
jgi:hypothetical protein